MPKVYDIYQAHFQILSAGIERSPIWISPRGTTSKTRWHISVSQNEKNKDGGRNGGFTSFFAFS